MQSFFKICLSLLLFSNKLIAQVLPDHTVILILENHSYNEIAGNASAPYINSLLTDANTAVMTASFALTHPSQPNYLMLFSGSAQGVTNDNLPSHLPFTTPNLGASLLQNGYSFAAYSQTMPSTGFTGATSGAYARKHCPWVNWQGTSVNGIAGTLNLPFTYFPTDFNLLPDLSFVIPDLNNDMHDGTIAQGDTWLKNNLDNYIQWCKKHNSLFILTFDEDDNSPVNQILTTITGQYIKAGNYNQHITHYDVLQTIEDLYKIPVITTSIASTDIQHIWLSAEICNNGNHLLISNLAGSSYQWNVNTGAGFAPITDNNFYTGTNTDTLQLNNIPSSWYGYQYSCAVDGNAGDTTSLKFTDYWNGTVSNAWEDAVNWSCGLPDSNTDVIIKKGKAVLHSNTAIRSMSIDPKATFIDSAGNTLTILH